MSRRDPVASALFGAGCVMVIGAPLFALAVSCTASSSQESVPPSRSATATPAPGASAVPPQREAQEGGPPVSAQFIA